MRNKFSFSRASCFILFCIVAIAFVIRVYGINWDQGTHLHPDERFLTMVTQSASLPSSFWEYFDPSISRLNPYNIGYHFYIYGVFPVTIAKVASVISNYDSYDGITIVGRFLSALADCITLCVLFKIVKLLEKIVGFDKRIKFISIFLYAFSVLPIQQSHFFTVDSFCVAFSFMAFYYALKNAHTAKSYYIIFSGIFFGFALGAKISALYVLPLLLLFLIINKGEKEELNRYISRIVATYIIFFIVSYISLRIADPRLFASPFFIDFRINDKFIENIKDFGSYNNATTYYPPGIQWISKDFFFPLKNIAFFGLGLPHFVLVCAGVYYILRSLCTFICTKFSARQSVIKSFFAKKNNIAIIFSIVLWCMVVYIYQSVQFTKTMRYFYVLYPFFAFFGAIGFLSLCGNKNRTKAIVCIIFVLLWPVSFMTIYSRPHTRVQASLWIYKKIPQNSVIAQEHWDDPLPLFIQGIAQKPYSIIQMPVFDPDTKEKWQTINSTLEKASYIIFTSNRGYGSIMEVPHKYPIMSAWYKKLFEGKTEFKKIKEFTSYPTFPLCFVNSIFCFSFPDQWAEEAFTVYDHPKVTIFKKT